MRLRARRAPCSPAYFERRVAFELKGDFDLVTGSRSRQRKLVVERLRTHFPRRHRGRRRRRATSPSELIAGLLDPWTAPPSFAPQLPHVQRYRSDWKEAGEIVSRGDSRSPSGRDVHAERGAGAYLNNRRIRVSAVKRAGRQRLASTGFPSRKRHARTSTSTSVAR